MPEQCSAWGSRPWRSSRRCSWAPTSRSRADLPMQAALLVALGSALGGVARYWCSNLAAALFGAAFPWGTLIINVAGSFVIGLFNVISLPGGRIEEPFDARLFVMVGVCGGFTTFSSFSLQTLSL